MTAKVQMKVKYSAGLLCLSNFVQITSADAEIKFENVFSSAILSHCPFEN